MSETNDNDGTENGAIDQGFAEAELSARERLANDAPDTPTAPIEGGIALDLVTRQILFVRREVAPNLAEYYEAEEFDLLNYGVHPFLPVSVEDRALECVFLSDITAESLGKFGENGKTYDFPEGRLAHVPIERTWHAGGGE